MAEFFPYAVDARRLLNASFGPLETWPLVSSSGRLPLPDGVGQVRHPWGGLRPDRLQGHAARVHALEQADSGAEQHGRQRDRELVDQAGVHVLQDRRAAARDTDVTVAGGRAGLLERGLDAVVDEVEGGPA